MISSRNMVSLEGGIVRDPEYREDIGLLTFSIGVDGAGREDKTTVSGFFDITAWVSENQWTAAGVAKQLLDNYRNGSLAKGARVNVVGRLNQDRFVTNDGRKANRIGIVADTVNIVFASKERTAPAGESASAGASDSAPPASQPASSGDEGYSAAPF